MTTLVGTGSSLFRPTIIDRSGLVTPGEYEIANMNGQLDLDLIDFEGAFKFYNGDRSINAVNRVRIVAPFGSILTDATGQLIAERELIIDVPGLVIVMNRPSRTPKEYFITVSGAIV